MIQFQLQMHQIFVDGHDEQRHIVPYSASVYCLCRLSHVANDLSQTLRLEHPVLSGTDREATQLSKRRFPRVMPTTACCRTYDSYSDTNINSTDNKLGTKKTKLSLDSSVNTGGQGSTTTEPAEVNQIHLEELILDAGRLVWPFWRTEFSFSVTLGPPGIPVLKTQNPLPRQGKNSRKFPFDKMLCSKSGIKAHRVSCT